MLSASRFIHQSIKSYNCGGMLQHSCSTSAHVFVRKAPSIYIPPHCRTVPASFRKFLTRFSTTLPFQWNKSRGKLFGKMARVQRYCFQVVLEKDGKFCFYLSCFSGSHLSKLQNKFVPGDELLDTVKSASYEPGEINEFSLLLKENMSEKLNGDRKEDAAIEEPYAASSFRNLLLYHAGSLSVDEDGGRIFLSDSNHHRIIVTDHDGRILDSIGSSPGFLDADFESAKLWRPAASFYNVSDGCLYFVDSEKDFKWLPQHHDRVRKNFEKRGSTRLRDMFTDIRKKGERPLWIEEDVWADLCASWGTPEYIQKRAQNKGNRASDSAGMGTSLHTGGSIPHAEHRRRLEKSLGRQPTVVEVHTRTHQRRETQEWITPKAQKAYNNAIRRADMTRRLVETMYPIPKSTGIWDRILGMWNWVLNYSGLAKDKTKTEEFGFDLISRPWHLLNTNDDELIIISHSFAVAWTMSMTTWKLKEVIRGFHNIFEGYGNLIVEKLLCMKDAYVVLPQKFSTSVSSEKIPSADLISSVRNFHDDIITFDTVGQSLLKYNKKSMSISHIHFSNVGLLGVPYWISCPIERVFNNGYYRQTIEHVHNLSVLPGRCNVRVNVEIPKDAVLAAPLDENCIWRQARGSAAEVSVLEEGGTIEEKVGVAQQWFDELDNLAFTNPEFESLELSGEVYDKSIDRSIPDTGKVHFNCAVNVSPGTSEIVVSAALYLKPNPALSFKEAVSLLNPQNHENGKLERESFNLFLEKCENISDIIFTKPLHLRIKLDCGDHPTAPTSKETILTDTRLEVNVTLE